MDKEIEKKNLYEVGNTRTIVFINNNLLYFANIGYSNRCLIGKKNEFITTEDKCTDGKEKIRIEKLGGQIIDDRLDGKLAISRRFGDYYLKNEGLVCEPHINKKFIDNSLNLNLDDISKITFGNKNNFDNSYTKRLRR